MPKTVLIVEDFADVRHLTRFIVESLGHSVVEAQNGLEAIKAVEEYFPDLILMDIAMPLMDGIAATKHIREIDQYRNTPILALTAYANEYVDEADKAGFDQILKKPIENTVLKEALDHYLGSEDSARAG
jgi:two-component system alkaline phosphatase synthesis response regulator PhoP